MRKLKDYDAKAANAHANMLDAIQTTRGIAGTEYTAAGSGQILACYAAASIRRQGVPPEKCGSLIAVLVWLIKHANPTSGRCDPSIRKLAIETGFGERTIKRAIETLEEMGYLRVEFRLGDTSAYHLNFEAMKAEFLAIEDEVKNLPPRSQLRPTQVGHGPDLSPQVTGDIQKRKAESVELKTYPKRDHPPSAAARGLSKERES